MHSLRELNDFLISKEIEIKEFGGWYLKVGKDTWTMAHDVFHKNGNPQSLKEKGLFDNYKKVKQNDREDGKTGTGIFATDQSNQTRKWRGIGSRNYK